MAIVTTWNSELLSVVLAERHDIAIHPSTVRRALARTTFRWRRARPTLNKRDPRKAEKLEAIQQAIDDTDPYTEVPFVDEADIDLNPRMYYPWIDRIERLWKAMHDTVTRNHRRSTLIALCQDVKRFFEVVQPFPGAGHGVEGLG